VIRISVYDWMKSNELRFVKKKKRKIISGDKRIKHLKNGTKKDSLDCFLDKNCQDGIFKSQFSKADFLKLTKKWKYENLENFK